MELGAKKIYLDWIGTVIRNVNAVHQTILMILNRSTYQRRAKNVQKKKFVVEICLLHKGLSPNREPVHRLGLHETDDARPQEQKFNPPESTMSVQATHERAIFSLTVVK